MPPRFVAHITLSEPSAEEAINAQTRASVENRLLGLQEISRVKLTMVPPLFPILNPAARR